MLSCMRPWKNLHQPIWRMLYVGSTTSRHSAAKKNRSKSEMSRKTTTKSPFFHEDFKVSVKQPMLMAAQRLRRLLVLLPRPRMMTTLICSVMTTRKKMNWPNNVSLLMHRKKPPVSQIKPRRFSHVEKNFLIEEPALVAKSTIVLDVRKYRKCSFILFKQNDTVGQTMGRRN